MVGPSVVRVDEGEVRERAVGSISEELVIAEEAVGVPTHTVHKHVYDFHGS